ncbi:ArsR/SmtB family transcription factor [Catelliglobosispora koreensis]|uniref:ArsR/SmtB family transcription factor n=1 Tax=Catelliglobosispora koreensis TaxID=129052 RepID=UPI00036DBA94|nr:metalloregulator ArsR/SmtB family transcription factor [Catelliglobosispora koreensis]
MAPRHLTDPSALAALAHPLRRRLMDMLRVYGPATASTLAERTGQAVANISHHLRVLGAADMIEEAPELARDKRERWWRIVTTSVRWSSTDFKDDPAGALVADEAQKVIFDQHTSLAKAWFAATPAEKQGWEDSSFTADKWMRLTPEELAQVSRDIIAVLDKWGNRELPDDGAERSPVLVFTYGLPAQP